MNKGSATYLGDGVSFLEVLLLVLLLDELADGDVESYTIFLILLEELLDGQILAIIGWLFLCSHFRMNLNILI